MKIKVPQNEFIVNQRYRSICDVTYSYSYYEKGKAYLYRQDDTKTLEEISKINSQIVSVYCQTNLVLDFIRVAKSTKKKIILFTGCSDATVDKNLFEKRTKNIIKWFAENINYNHCDLIPTPIGSLVGSWIGNEEIPDHLKITGHKDYLKIPVNNALKDKINMVLMAFSLNTNQDKRIPIYEYLKEQKYVSNFCSNNSNNKQLSEKQFCEKIYNHDFIVSPPGNGIDCGRTWVSLQLGSIPIVQSSIFTEYFRNKLPIFIYKNISDVTEENLKKFKSRANYDYNLLNINYYKKAIEKIKKEY